MSLNKKEVDIVKKKVKELLKCALVFGISFVIAGAITGGMHSDAAGTYPAGAGTVAAIQSRGTLKYEIDGLQYSFVQATSLI